jgi:uncharacterized protein with beta-barrel porin domain
MATKAAPASPAAAPLGQDHWWSSVFYRANATGSSAGIAGNSTSISGFIAGVEGEIRPGLLFGVAASSAHTDAAGLASGSGDNLAVVAYARKAAGPLQAAAYAGGVRDDFGLRHDFGNAAAPTNQSSGATSLIAGGSIAYTIRMGGFQVTPTATAAFTHMLFDGARTTSPQGFALDVPRQFTDRIRLTLGPSISRSLTTEAGVKLYASASAGFLYQSDPATALDALFFSIPTVAQSAPGGGAGGFADLALNVSLTIAVTGFVRWRGEVLAHAYSNQLSGGVAVTF